jgi:hypothetical protein
MRRPHYRIHIQSVHLFQILAMAEQIKKRLLYGALILLLLPALQQQFHFIHSGKLKGGFKEAVDSTFSISSWLSATYQHQHEQYINDHTGFRPDIVRINNQLDYSLFDICHAEWTVKGKDNYLFQGPYILAYYGRDFVGYDNALQKALKLKALQDTLARLGKSLILAYLPSKATFYPEYFPADRVEARMQMTNHNYFRHVGDSLGINQVDMDAWFLSMKGKSHEPLFSKQGIHWTLYGAILGGDSLMRYVEKLRHIHIQHPQWSGMEHTDNLRAGDDDVASELNLIFPVAHETMAYPVIHDTTDTTGKINAIYIGDSYAQKMVEFGILHYMNNQCELWSYYNEMHDINGHKFAYIRDYNWQAAINRADIVVIAYTSFNFPVLGNGFIEQAYDYYYPHSK